MVETCVAFCGGRVAGPRLAVFAASGDTSILSSTPRRRPPSIFPPFAPETAAKLCERRPGYLPRAATNPFDTGGGPPDGALEAIARDPGIDGGDVRHANPASSNERRMGSIEPLDAILAFALPMGVVKKLWLMGGWFDADRALQWQYVQRVVPPDRLTRELRRWAEQAALVPAERYATAKQDLRRLYAIRGLVAGSELRPPAKDSRREAFYRALAERGMRAALQYRDAEFDEEISKI